MAFFVSFMMITVFFMINLMVATFFNQVSPRFILGFVPEHQREHSKLSLFRRAFQFRIFRQRHLIQSHEQERQSLHYAFATLDIFNKGVISISLLDRLLRRLRPSIDTYQILAFYRLLQQGNKANGLLNEMQFLKVRIVIARRK